MWYKRIDTFLKSIGLYHSHNDYNLYYLGEGPDRIALVFAVDDLFITGGDIKRITWLKQELQKQFEMTNLGLVTKYLGVEFTRLRDGRFFMSQQDYVNQMLKEAKMNNCKLEHVPLPLSFQLVLDMNTPATDSYNYCKLVGKLIFLTTT